MTRGNQHTELREAIARQQAENNALRAQLRVVLAHVEELRAAREEAQQVINRQGGDILAMHTEIEHLKAYTKHERSLGAEGPMIELVSARQEIEQLKAVGNATFMAMCAYRDNSDEEVFQDAIDALGAALKEPTPNVP